MPLTESRFCGLMGTPASASSMTRFPEASSFGRLTSRPASTTVSITITGLLGATCHPAADPMADSVITITVALMKRKIGSGSLLPSHSIRPRIPGWRADGVGVAMGRR